MTNVSTRYWSLWREIFLKKQILQTDFWQGPALAHGVAKRLGRFEGAWFSTTLALGAWIAKTDLPLRRPARGSLTGLLQNAVVYSFQQAVVKGLILGVHGYWPVRTVMGIREFLNGSQHLITLEGLSKGSIRAE